MVFFKSKLESARLIIPSALTIIGINIILNSHFYPFLLSFQTGSAANKLIQEKNIPLQHLYIYKSDDQTISFSSNHVFTNLSENMVRDSVLAGKKIWIYTEQESFNKLTEIFTPSNVYPIDYFHVTRLTSKFINPKTRSKALTKRYLLEI